VCPSFFNILFIFVFIFCFFGMFVRGSFLKIFCDFAFHRKFLVFYFVIYFLFFILNLFVSIFVVVVREGGWWSLVILVKFSFVSLEFFYLVICVFSVV